ncbi:MAG: hypothetical protein IKG89_01585 [Oscillospiraceae bacterium]|nr:hypothetical protein [Oscillospiraceae bacterium]
MPKSKAELIAYILLRGVVLIILVAELLTGQWFNVFLCFLTLLLFMVPTIVERHLQLELPGPLEIVILCFIFSSAVLGEIAEFYVKVPGWDTMLHTLNGFLMAAIGFSLIDLLNRSPRFHISLSPFFVAFVAFCFSMTTGVVWEFVEFTIDRVLHMDMQKDFVVTAISSVSLNPDAVNSAVLVQNIRSTTILWQEGEVLRETVINGGYLDIGLVDTMKDLIVNCIGAIVFSLIGAVYLHRRGKGAFVRGLIPRLMTREEMDQRQAEARRIAESQRQRRRERRKNRGK